MKTRVYVALGSNQGDRVSNLRIAIDRVSSLSTGPVDRSSFYMTDPQDMEDDAEEFANAVIGFDTGLAARELLVALQGIEIEMGRPRDHGRNESRSIDLDIICYGDEVVSEPGLVIPHPRAHERQFVLLPLAEIAPDIARKLRNS